MKKNSIVALSLVVIWFLGKLIFLKANIFQTPETVKYMVMWNIFCMIAAMSLGALAIKRNQHTDSNNALIDMKSFISTGMIYTLSVSILLFLYYKKIDPSYNKRQQTVALKSVEKEINTPLKLKKFQQNNPNIENKSKEEILEMSKQNVESMYSAGAISILNLLGMLLLSVLNGVILTYIFRRVLNKVL